jgi:multidrug efflux pump subunit AcrA (membrane-fusion protein)
MLRLIFVAVSLLSLSACATRDASADQASPQPITVRVAKPIHVRVPAEINLSGTIATPAEPAKVGFQVSGKVIRVGPREGDFVKAGDVLAEIDPD